MYTFCQNSQNSMYIFCQNSQILVASQNHLENITQKDTLPKTRSKLKGDKTYV